eukprot:5658790-Pyramimonas_sp.AAC.1
MGKRTDAQAKFAEMFGDVKPASQNGNWFRQKVGATGVSADVTGTSSPVKVLRVSMGVTGITVDAMGASDPLRISWAGFNADVLGANDIEPPR